MDFKILETLQNKYSASPLLVMQLLLVTYILSPIGCDLNLAPKLRIMILFWAFVVIIYLFVCFGWLDRKDVVHAEIKEVCLESILIHACISKELRKPKNMESD